MLYQSLPPHASSLTESMRDIGYSLETAVADIIDNSIAAGATEVSIRIDFESASPLLCIIDNGRGMNLAELIDAMRYGSKHPRDVRTLDDFGRFGLGLKTASFSQCRRLTVISSQKGKLEGAIWDLDTISGEDEWMLGILESVEIASLPYISELVSTGTMILWEKLDRLCGSEFVNKDVLYEKLELVDHHLSLVFHRFLVGEIKGKKLKIMMNNHNLEAFDPFCVSNKATQLLPEEIVRIEGHEIKIQPYILPHHSKLSLREHDYYQSRSEFVSNQGIYVYRNSRLMAWGSWFRLVPKGESTKLARVKIDFPNALDEQWTIDIKKSRAYPPPQVRDRLRHVLTRIIEQSTRVHTGRGRRLFDENHEPFWVRYAEHGGVRYSLNKDHPVLVSYQQMLEPDQRRLFQEVLTVVEDSIPVEAIYSDYSMTPKIFDDAPALDVEDILRRLSLLCEILSAEKQLDADSFRKIVNNLKPFCDYPKEIERVIKEKLHE
jgi:Histidine kinase-, DNA gyrase B-, and HSP90-like ATPase